MADVRSLLLKKSEQKAAKKLVLKDVNRPLMVALLAIPTYGKEARDEEVLSIIINAGQVRDTTDLMDRIRANYDARVAAKEIKKVKGETRDKDGFLVLVPRR